MIKSFKDKSTEEVFNGEFVLRYPHDIQRIMLRKLTMIHAAASIQDLRIPPSNHLEKLEDNLKGFWSIRINDQWRIIFRWLEGNAHDVQILDYH